MKLYHLHDYLIVPRDCNMWVRFLPQGPWMPCLINVALVGVEHRVELFSAWFDSMNFWPEDPSMREEYYDEMVFLGPIPQPEMPDES